MLPTDHDQRLDALAAVSAFERGDRDALAAVVAANAADPARLVTGLAHLVHHVARWLGEHEDDDDRRHTSLPLLDELRAGVLDTLVPGDMQREEPLPDEWDDELLVGNDEERDGERDRGWPGPGPASAAS